MLELLNQKNYNWKHPKGVFVKEGTFSEWQVILMNLYFDRQKLQKLESSADDGNSYTILYTILVFLAVQDSSITDIVCPLVGAN